MTLRTLPLSGAAGDAPVRAGALQALQDPHGAPGTLRRVVSGHAGRVEWGGRTAAIWLGDSLGALATCLLATWVEPWLGRGSTSARASFATLTFVVLLAALAFHSWRAPRRRRLVPTVADDLGSLLGVVAGSGVVLLALHAVEVFRAWTPQPEVGLVIGTAAIVAPAARAAALFVASLGRAAVVRTAIVGNGPVADQLARRLGRSRFVEVVGLDPPGVEEPSPVRSFDALAALVLVHHVDKVLVTRSAQDEDDGADVLQALRGTIDIDIVCGDYPLCGWDTRLSDITGLSVLSLGRAAGGGARAVKRLIDIVIAASGLVVLAPALLAVALAVRVGSEGPVLFRQRRVGRGQRPFTILKFRTMKAAGPAVPEAQAVEPIGGAERARRTPLDVVADPALVTRVGAFLRRTGIDELPQLWNVLRGEMSIVGPRPFVPDECAAIDGWRARRFEVRPGMTGLWQVCGQHDVTMEDLCRLDVQYATTWSLGSDLRIMARTPKRLLLGSRHA